MHKMVMIWFLIGVSLFGATRVPSTEELKEYVAQVYRADYLKLDEAGQTKIKLKSNKSINSVLNFPKRLSRQV